MARAAGPRSYLVPLTLGRSFLLWLLGVLIVTMVVVSALVLWHEQQVLENLPRIAALEQWPIAAFPGTRYLLVDARIQIDDKTPRAEVVTIFGPHHGTAPRREPGATGPVTARIPVGR